MKKFGKRLVSLICIFALILPMFVPAFSVKADNPYSVVMVSNSSNNQTVGTYATYNEAVKAMNAQTSTSTSVASVYKNGVIINSKYAIFQFKPNTGTINLYQNASDSIAYTYTNPSSMTDSAFIDSNESRVQIMLNGFKGWADINSGNIIPISLLGSNAVNITASRLNLRAEASTTSTSLAAITCTNTIFTYTEKTNAGGYTWYKISYNGKTGWVASGTWLTETTGASLDTYYYRYSSGNLLHRYAYHNGSAYSDYFTNLGPTPSYLIEGVHYYSFDGGIYLYSTLTSMLDDYRSNSFSRSINASNPNYPYYLFLPNKSISKITASELDSQITNTSSKLYGSGKYFKEAESLYGMNALSAFATAKNESASGTSKIAIDKNNVFGYGAADSCPYDCAKTYASVRDSIMDYAKNGLTSYMIAGSKYYFGTHSGNKGSGRNVKYASDPLWGEKQAANAFTTDKKVNLRDYNANTIGVTKYGKYNVPVYKDASASSVIYYMRNSDASLEVYNVPVTVIDKVGDFYKIYADSSTYQYGYIKVSDLNVSNSQPVITASDKTIKLNGSFDYLEGVSATDAENGNLTSEITYYGSVDTAKSGVYEIVYTVVDNSNFSVSKTVNITVKDANAPIINAIDKEISQYTLFDPMEGVTASDEIDGDITSKVTYTGVVNTDVKGEYEVTYSVTNDNEKTTTKTVKITVIDNEKPVITASDKIVYLNGSFNQLDGVSASDKEDGDITKKIGVTKNDVNTSVIGEYEVEYTVTDEANQTVTKVITVSVIEKEFIEANGWFHLEKVDFKSDKLEISGFNIVNGVNNGVSDEVRHELILEEQNTGKSVSYSLDRWLTSYPFVPSDSSNKNYDGSWFMGSINLSLIEEGDYTMYIRTEAGDYYTKQIVSNIEYTNNITRKYEDSSNRGYFVKENQVLPTVDLELFVRDDGLISYGTTPVRSGLLSDFFSYNFEGGTLNIVGNSYALKNEYNSGSNVEREIIFENKETYEIVYRQEIGSITDGPYQITSLTSNDLTRAWFDAKVDIKDLDKGNYVIYIKTKANGVEDYSELVDYAYSNLSLKAEVNDKQVKLVRNSDQRVRLELVIE